MEFYGEYNSSTEKAFKDYDKNYKRYEGVVLCGTHSPLMFEIDFLLNKIKEAREKKTPLYAECFGYQLCAIEYARNVLGIKDATSEEFGNGTFVVKKNKEGLNVGLKGGESYWNNYHVELDNWVIPENFFIAQYHASYQSYKDKPHPLIKQFLVYANNFYRKSKVRFGFDARNFI
jgi:CTP synthase (UTP-ammonia lyase)